MVNGSCGDPRSLVDEWWPARLDPGSATGVNVDLHTIVGALCGVLLVVELGWRKAVVTVVLMGVFLTLCFALFSSWVVVAVLLIAASAALRFIRRRRERADARPESG